MTGAPVLGYRFGDDTYCASCLLDLMRPPDLADTSGSSTEDVLDRIARDHGLDRDEENSFTTFDFPHRLQLADADAPVECVLCGRLLAEPPSHG